MRRIGFALVIAAVVLVGSGLRAGAGDRPRRDDRVRTLLVLRIAEELDLGDEKALKISRILKEGEERRDALRDQREALAPQLTAAIEAADEDAIAKLVADARELDRKMMLVASESFAEMDSVLSVVERGKLTLLLPEIRKQLRRGSRRDRRDWRSRE
jgi:hypothetical protein